MKTTNPLLAKLRHHVTGAIERGEGVAIAGIPATNPTASFTPGPWTLHTGSQTGNVWIENEDGDKSIIAPAYAFGHAAMKDNEAMANARLIASAPDLLAALEAALAALVEVSHSPQYRETVLQARAAIARAKGVQS